MLSDNQLYHLDSSYKVIDTLAIERLHYRSSVVCLNNHQVAVSTQDLTYDVPPTILIVSLHGSTSLPTEEDKEQKEE